MAVAADQRIPRSVLPVVTGAARPPGSVPARRRLRRRRRVTALVAVATLCFLAGLIAGVVASSDAGATTAHPAVEPEPTLVIVQPGDTLWSIAREIQPTGDVRGLVDELSSLHGGGALDVGDRLVIPARLARG